MEITVLKSKGLTLRAEPPRTNFLMSIPWGAPETVLARFRFCLIFTPRDTPLGTSTICSAKPTLSKYLSRVLRESTREKFLTPRVGQSVFKALICLISFGYDVEALSSTLG